MKSKKNRYLWRMTDYLVAMLIMLINGSVWAEDVRNVHLFGSLVAEPCSIPSGEENITLDFGSVVDKYLYQNNRTVGQTFNINLTDCDLSLGRMVKVSFSGTESTALPGFLALESSVGAQGVVIGMETQDGKLLAINSASAKFSLQGTSNTLSLKAFVRGEPAAIASRNIKLGAFTATATFALEYD